MLPVTDRFSCSRKQRAGQGGPAQDQVGTSTKTSRACHLPRKYWYRLMPRLRMESAREPRSLEMAPAPRTTMSVRLPTTVQLQQVADKRGSCPMDAMFLHRPKTVKQVADQRQDEQGTQKR